MQRFSSVRIGFLSAFVSIVFVVSMMSFPSTASAHTTTAARVNPHISVVGTEFSGRACSEVTIRGTGFSASRSGHTRFASFTAFGFFGSRVTVSPSRVRINSNGNFTIEVTICGFNRVNPCNFFSGRCNPCDFGVGGQFCRPSPICRTNPNNPSCRFRFFPRAHRIVFRLFATDDHTGVGSNSVLVSIGNFRF